MDLGISRIFKADSLLGSPSQRFRSIHVAGTNGKGTVSTKIAKTLTKMGFKVGLFTSPHIDSFRERIQIDSKLISESDAITGLKEIFAIMPDITFFEIMTLLAFCYFDREGVDYAVIETGLGGDKDATNILKPMVSVITNISNDHAHILGDSLDEIAVAKAGIIKKNTPVVLGSRAVRAPILEMAFKQRAPIHFVKPCSSWLEENKAIAKAALNLVLSVQEIDVSGERPPCRFEEYQDTIFDGAHNEDGINELFKEVKRKYPNRKIYTVFSLSSSKDVGKIIPIIKNGSDHLFYYEGDHPRLADFKELKPYIPSVDHFDLDQFVSRARSDNGIVLITGSFFIMTDLKERLGFTTCRDPVLLTD